MHNPFGSNPAPKPTTAEPGSPEFWADSTRFWDESAKFWRRQAVIQRRIMWLLVVAIVLLLTSVGIGVLGG